MCSRVSCAAVCALAQRIDTSVTNVRYRTPAWTLCRGITEPFAGFAGLEQQLSRRIRVACAFGQLSSEFPGAWQACIQAEHVTGDPAQSLAARHLASGITRHSLEHGHARWSLTARGRQLRQQHRTVVRLAAQHHAIGPRELTNYLFGSTQTAIEHHRDGRKPRLERPHHVITQRRNLAVVARRPGSEHRLARMHDDGVTTCSDDATDEFLERSMFGGTKPRCGLTCRLAARQSFTTDLRAVDNADAKFHRHRNTH